MNQIYLELTSFLRKMIVANQKTDIVTDHCYKPRYDKLDINLP